MQTVFGVRDLDFNQNDNWYCFNNCIQSENKSQKCDKWALPATLPRLHCVGAWAWMFGWPPGALFKHLLLGPDRH